MKVELRNIYGGISKLEIVENDIDANFITHNGTFHADEVMSTVFLLNKHKNIKLCRTREINNNDAFIYDVGFGKFDHHQNDFDKVRNNGIKYATCGLIWEAFGKEIISELGIENIDLLYESIEKNLVFDIDRDDNGQTIDKEPSIKNITVHNIIGMFNPNWDELDTENEAFLEAIKFANNVFNNLVSKMVAKEKARKIVEDKIEESENGILMLDSYMPWKDIVLTSTKEKAKEIFFAIFPSKTGGYAIVATPKESNSFELRKEFKEEWGGKSKEELVSLTGIKTFKFCHKNLFICSCETKEDALLIAKKALDLE